MRKTLLLMGSLFLLAFCAQTRVRHLPSQEGVVFPVEPAAEMAYEGQIAGEIFVREDTLFFATWGGDVVSVESKDNRLIWRVQLGESLGGPPALSGDSLLVADRNNTLHCLDLSGGQRWRKTVESAITGPAEGIGQCICFGTENGNLVALDRTDGRELWRYTSGAAVRSNPVEAGGRIVFGSDDHFLYLLDMKGSLVSQFEMDDRIGPTLCPDGHNLCFGTENGFFISFDLKRGIVRWKVRTGGSLSAPPLVSGSRIYFLTWDSVIYCLNRNTGTILWWQGIPSRVPYRLLNVEDKVVVSSLSSMLLCLDGKTGNTLGRADLEGEMKSNAVWISPRLLVSVFDRIERTEKIVLLKKQVRVILSSAPESPQAVDTDILFSADAVGFFQPSFEFFLTEGEVRRTVQEESEKSQWAWFPSEPGDYSVGVVVRDERQTKEAEIPFVVEREKPQVSFSYPASPPFRPGEDILFSVSTKGMTDPAYRLRLLRLMRFPFGTGGYLLLEEKGSEGQIRESVRQGSWIWTPQKEGIYLICVLAWEDDRQAAASEFLLIAKGNI